jgi:hypothetical protein
VRSPRRRPSTDTPIQYVARPVDWRRWQRHQPDEGLVQGILHTAVNGQAIKIALNGESLERVYHRYRRAVSAEGYRLHYRRSPDNQSLTVWAEQGTARS